jgi:SulP family sulfate permease
MTWLPKSVVCLRYYDRFRFRSDLLASLILALEAFPFCIAIAITSGLPAVYGVSGAVAASLVASALGDSKIRVSAPSLVFIVVASSVVAREGISGLFLSTLLAGVLLIFFGAIKVGVAIQKLPRPLTVGLSTGVAFLLVIKTLPGLLGISTQAATDGMPWGPLRHLREVSQVESRALFLGLAALILIGSIKMTIRHLPAGLLVMATGALLVRFGHLAVPAVGIVQPALFSWHVRTAFRPELLSSVISHAFMIAVLVAIESLQATNVASDLTGEGVNPNIELAVQGGANIAAALVGVLPVCGNPSYTSKNVLFGAQTPTAGILQSLFLTGILLLVAPVLGFVPLPVIAALIFSSVWSMQHWKELPRLFKIGWAQVAAWIAISLLTIIDLTTAIAVGVLVTMFLYIRNYKKMSLSRIRNQPADAN